MAIRNPATTAPSAPQPTSDASKKYSFVQQSMTHPKFLHSNSTSHIWSFGAIAELIDNAVDPDVKATKFWIDVEEDNGEPRLCFTDNGFGMESEKLHKMLSFGYCEKEEVEGHKPIGHYGNGFKSGSMRLGRDALVFTRSKSTFSIGMLSQTFLFAENASSVLVPMVTWDATGKCLTELQAAEQCLGAIQTYSPFKTIHDIMNRFKKIPNSTKGGTGTHIVVYNLRKEQNAPYELDFNTDQRDVRVANVVTSEGKKLHFQQQRTGQGTQIEIPIDFSLREYCSILYLKPRMIIILRGSKVRSKLVESSLGHTMYDTYKHSRITFGMNVDNPNLYGIMLYHRNRLIKPYLRVGIQNQINPDAVGVIGILEADFLQPTHNKQDFDVNTNVYKNCILTLASKLETYWKSYKTRTVNRPSSASDLPDTWAQCEDCNKWRRMPPHVKPDMLPEHWYCRDNIYDPRKNTCDAPEENQVEAVIQNSVGDLKQVRAEERKKEKEAKRREEEQKRLEAERKRAEEEQKRKHIEEQQRILKLREEELQRKNKEIEEIKRAREAKKKAKEAQRRAALEEEKRLAAQSEAVKRVNNEVGGASQSSLKVGSSTAGKSASSAATRTNEQVVQIEEELIKQEPSPVVSLNATAAQLRNSGGTAEDLESRKRKREENTATELPSNKAPRTEVTQSPHQSAATTSEPRQQNSSISPSSATNPMPAAHNSQSTQAINRDESLIENFFGDTQSTPVPKNEMHMDEDQDIDLNDASFDLMAEYSSSQPQNSHVDVVKQIANGAGSNATVSGLLKNVHKLLKAYSVIVPEQAEQLQTSMIDDPDKLATLDLDPLIMALTKKRSSEQMAAKAAERELISMQRKVREVLTAYKPDQAADVPESELYPLFCDFVASYKKKKEK